MRKFPTIDFKREKNLLWSLTRARVVVKVSFFWKVSVILTCSSNSWVINSKNMFKSYLFMKLYLAFFHAHFFSHCLHWNFYALELEFWLECLVFLSLWLAFGCSMDSRLELKLTLSISRYFIYHVLDSFSSEFINMWQSKASFFRR